MQALVTSTSSSAACIGLADQVLGTLASGDYADLIVVEGHPWADIRNLQDPERIKLVMKAGSYIPVLDHLTMA